MEERVNQSIQCLMNWERLKPNHYFEDPVQHIYTQTIFDTKQYDTLYENQNNLEHRHWQYFNAKYKITYKFKENFSDLDYNREVICLWFFKERSDRYYSHINLHGKKVEYHPNAFLITRSKDISFERGKKDYIRNPFLQLDLSLQQYKDIVRIFQK